MVPQHHTLSEWRGVGDRAISVAIVFYAADVAHKEFCAWHGASTATACVSVTKTEGGTTNLRCMCAVYQLLSMLRMRPIENCAWPSTEKAQQRDFFFNKTERGTTNM